MLFSLFCHCRKVLQSLWPQPAVRLNKKAARLRARDKPGEAVALLDEAIRLDSQMAEAYVNRSACYCDLHEYAKAIADADHAIALASEMADPFRYRAYAAHSLGQTELAIADLTRALQLDSEDPWIYHERSWAFYYLRDYSAALADAERFLEQCPREAEGYYGRANCRFLLGELDLALSDIDEALRFEKNDATSQCFRARLLYAANRIDEASAQFESAVAQDPELEPSWLGGVIALKQGNYQEAIGQFDAVLAVEPTAARVYYDRGKAWYQLKEYENALRDLDEAVKLKPKSGTFLRLRAKLLFLLDRIEEASAAYEIFLAQKREAEEEYWDWLGGAIALKQGNYWEAIAQFNAVLAADSTIARAYNGRGEAWCQMKEYERAWSDFDMAVTVAPENPIHHINRASALMGLGRYADGKRDLLEARRRDPDCAHSYASLAWYMATCPEPEVRNGKQAVAMALKAMELAGGHPTWRLCATLAAAYAENGEFDEAIRWQTEVLATGPEEDRHVWEAVLKAYRAGIPRRIAKREDFDW